MDVGTWQESPDVVPSHTLCNPHTTNIREWTFSGDPLWDGAGCDRGSCCQFNSPPWFCKDLPHPTSEDIELRLCLNEASDDEDVPFESGGNLYPVTFVTNTGVVVDRFECLHI